MGRARARSARDASSFRLATLDGHLEAGEIEFRAETDGDGLRFEIESWARAGDRLSNLLSETPIPRKCMMYWFPTVREG